jgi:hypothetical protein
MPSTWFYGDNWHGENPQEFLTDFKTALIRLPHLSESAKCKRFYNHCKSDFDTEDWYENLEKNSPAAIASWSDLILHFRVKWLGAAPDTLLEIKKPVTTTELDTATTITYETSTTTTTNANTTITTTTTTPAPTSTAALPVHKTTTMPARPNRVADTQHVITPPMLNPAQHEAETTNASMDSSPSNIGATYTAVRQHGRTKEEPEVERVEMLKEEEKGGEKRKEMSEREVEWRETEAGEQEGIGMTQGEAQDPVPSPTAREAANARPYEPVQSDWVAEVDEAMGLSPAVHNTPQSEPADPAPAPINPAPGDVTVNPIRTAFANAVPADPVPVDPAPASTTNPVHTAPADPDPVPASPVPTEPAPTNPVPADPVPVDPAPVDPDHAARASTAPVDPIHGKPVRTVPIDPDPDPVNPSPGDAAADATAPTFPSAEPAIPAPVLIHTALTVPVDPDPVNPVHTAPVDPISVPVRPVPTNPTSVDPDPVHTAHTGAVPIDPDPVNPVSVASTNPSPITFIIKKLSLHQISIHLPYVKSSQFFRVRWRGFGSRTRAFAI